MWLGWIFSSLTIIGAILNALHNKWGFIIWIITNICWIIYNVVTNTFEQIPVWVVLTIICVYGFKTWSRGEKDGKETNRLVHD